MASRKRARPASVPGAAPAAFEVPEWARRWRAGNGIGACVKVNDRGVELSYYDEGTGQRLACFVPRSKFPTENAAAYALASGALRFSKPRPVRGRAPVPSESSTARQEFSGAPD